MDENLLLAQITALEKNIDRMTALLNSGELYRSQAVRGKFQLAINPPKAELSKLKKNVQEKSLTEEEVKWSWNKLHEHKAKVQSVFDQCLDYVGGIALRSWKLEEDICDIAEALVQYFNLGGTWGSVAIVGEDRIFDQVSKTTQLIRLRFPEWGVWSLSFTASEFGQWIAHQDEGLTNFFNEQKERVIALIKTTDPQSLVTDGYIDQSDIADGKIRNLAPDIDALRQSYQTGDDISAKLQQQLNQHASYLQMLFADAFGTYFLGPAYPYSLLCMRIEPLTAHYDTPQKPALARRMDLTWQLLKKLGEPAKETDQYASNPYDPELDLLKKLWEQTIQMVSSGYKTNFAYGSPYNNLADPLYVTLENTYGRDGFGLKDWEAAKTLGQEFIRGNTSSGETISSLAVVLNAAWFARIRHPDLSSPIEKQAYQLMKTISGRTAEVQQSTAKPGAR